MTEKEKLDLAEEIAERLRQEPYHLFRNDCFTKSRRFVQECKKRNIKAKLVWCVLGLVKVRLPIIGLRTIPFFLHFWGEVDGQRFEVSRPLGEVEIFGIVPADIKPIKTIKF